jgi:nicotinic acid mononucleotide adenylyltransferase/predicted nucleotidyltransferase
MESFKTFTESIIDAPRRTYAPGVFDDADTSDPKIKASVKKIVDAQIKEFAKEYPVIKIGLVGSILTKRYRNDADLDFNVLFDVPKEKQEDERINLSKKYLSASNPDNIQGKLIPGTEHPINYYLITDSKTYQDQEDKADAVFDYRNNKFSKRPEDYTFDMNLYLKDFQKKVDEIDVVKGELKRDIIDYDELSELTPKDIVNLQDKIDGKLKEIEKDIQDIINIGDTVDVERRTAFDTDMSPDEIKKYSIKNRLPKNVVYKMLEKYHYLKFWKKCKKILDDGKVTDAEIDSLRKEHAQSETRAVAEALDKGNTLVFAFGRFNPPTVGHGKLMSKVITEARKNNANNIVYASASTDKRSNPLDVKTKVKFMKKMFPANKIQAAGGNQRTFIEVLKFYNKMYGNIIMIAGSDRVSEFQKLTDKYNGKEYNFKSIKVVSSGERDPDAEGITGMSASKMREMAKNGDAKNFKKGVPNLSDSDASELFNAVRKGMGISGRNYPLIINSFTNFVNNDLREEYHQEKIFNVGDMVEHMDGTSGMVVRRGSNYVSYETDDNLIKKAWLYDIQPSEKQPEKKTNVLETVEKELDEAGIDTVIRHLKRLTVDRGKIKAGISAFKDLISRGVEASQAAWDASRIANVAPREFIDGLKSAGLFKESFGFGTDEYAQHTMSMTPGQPIQNFRKSSDPIKYKDIEEFATQSDTIDKYKERFKERWREELDKAVQRMREEL